MNPIKEEISYEEKMDKITEQLEELILDVLIVTLEKIRNKNQLYDQLLYRSKLIF
jgi:hypothetical protein